MIPEAVYNPNLGIGICNMQPSEFKTDIRPDKEQCEPDRAVFFSGQDEASRAWATPTMVKHGKQSADLCRINWGRWLIEKLASSGVLHA